MLSYPERQGPIAHDDVIKWKCYWPFVRRIHRSPVNSPHKGQWRGALMFSLIWAWTNDWVNNWNTGDLRHHHAHYDVTGMYRVNNVDMFWRLDDQWQLFTRQYILRFFLQARLGSWLDSISKKLGLYSPWLSGKTSYCKIPRSLEAVRFGFTLFQSFWNLAAAEMPVKFQSDAMIKTSNLAASRLHEILR